MAGRYGPFDDRIITLDDCTVDLAGPHQFYQALVAPDYAAREAAAAAPFGSRSTISATVITLAVEQARTTSVA